MKLRGLRSAFRLSFFFVLLADAGSALSLDREAFTFTNYDLTLRVEPDLQRLGGRGTITLRNDSATPQRIAVLQISSSLSWRSIKLGDKVLQFVSQPYNSDIDHTGLLSEAIVTLPAALAPKSTVNLEIVYEGIIGLDAARLTKIGSPASAAQSTDWDRISAGFTAVRGIGYVAWYPVATEAASLAEGTELFEAVGRWKMRESGSAMHLVIEVPSDDEGDKPELLVNATACPTSHEVEHKFVADCTYSSLGSAVPTFVIANYEIVDRASVAVHFFHGHEAAAASYADAAEKVVPLVSDWFGSLRSKGQTADLPDPNAAPFESGSLLLTPLQRADPKLAGLVAVHQLAHAAFFSPRPWINEGVAHFAQALYLERQSGRQAALDYMGLHRSAFSTRESNQRNSGTAPRSDDEASQSLVKTFDEELYRSKAMFVWWMLRELIGDEALKKALASYRPEQDKDSSYLPRLIAAQTQKDLEWFFDDWVYRDRGLPDFKVESASTRQTLPEGYMVAITVSNAGAAGAEVPVTVKFAGGEVMKRLIVRGKTNGVIRIQVPKPPEEVEVNDGSVPETDRTNNVFKIEAESAK